MVQRQRHVGAVHGLLGTGQRAGDLLAAVTLLVDDVTVRAGQRGVLHAFHPGDALAGIVHAAEQRAELGAVGVDALAAQLAIDHATQIQVVDGPLDRRRHVLLQDHVPAGAGQFGAERLRVHLQHGCQQTGHARGSLDPDRLAVDLVAESGLLRLLRVAVDRLELRGRPRVGDDRVSLDALRQHGAVRVGDLAAHRVDDHLLGPGLGRRLCGHLAVYQLDGGQLEQACGGDHREYDADGDALEEELAASGEPYHCGYSADH